MRRLIYLLLLVLFVSVSATCVSASTDCERWFIAYRRELAHTRTLQRVAAAKRRAKLYAQRKAAGYVPPKPRLVPASAPRMTRKQTLHHFELACGVLPEDEADGPAIAEETPAPFPHEHPLNDGIDLLPAIPPDDMITENDVPPPPSTGAPNYPSGGGPPIYTPPFTGAIAPPGGGGGGGTPPPVIPPPNNPPVVPEPSSYILLITGLAGAAGEIRRRIKR